jgi:putative DNA primase/helicase
MGSPISDAALDYARLGWRLIPVHAMRDGLCTCRRVDCPAPAKHPAIDRWQVSASNEPGVLTAWFRGDYNVGLVLGASDMVAVDIDTHGGDGYATVAALEDRLGPLPRTVTALTGGGGEHRLFQSPACDLRVGIGPAVQLLRGRQQILVSPSIHRSGRAYQWKPGHAPGDVDVACLPGAWIDEFRPAAPKPPPRSPAPSSAPTGEDFYAALEQLDQGYVLEAISGTWLVDGQQIELRRTSGGRRDLRIDGQVTRGFVDSSGKIGHEAKNQSRPDGGPLVATWCRYYGHSDAEIRRGLVELVPELARFGERRANGHKIALREPPAFLDREDDIPPDDLGSAPPADGDHPHAPGGGRPGGGGRLLATSTEPLDVARVVYADLGRDAAGRQTLAVYLDDWWRYSDGHHRLLDAQEVRGLVWLILERVDCEHFDDDGNALRKPLGASARKVNEIIDAMAAVADRVSSQATLPFPLDGYAGPPPREIAVVKNGLLELATRRLHPPTPRIFATAGAAVDYDPEATCPTWLAFLEQIFADEDCGDDGVDRESIRLVQQIFGWLVSGDTTRHAIPLFVGPPRSGKSTMMAILRELLGENTTTSPSLALLSDSRFGLASFLGKTAAIIPDARLSSRADQAQIANTLLAVSGQDTIEIDRKNRDPVHARLRCRIILVTNELPQIGDSSGALASRWLIVETRQSFLGREDRGLEDRLRAELPGILRWALDGWDDLRVNGWVRPARTVELSEELDKLGSPLKAFAEERLSFDNAAETPIREIYREWKSWCDAVGRDHPGTEQSFGKSFRAAYPRLKKAQRGSGGLKHWVYLGLRIRGLL